MEEMLHEKYMAEIEAHADIIIQICKDYGKEIGEASAKNVSDEFGDIAREDAERTMLLGVIKYTLDTFMDGAK